MTALTDVPRMIGATLGITDTDTQALVGGLILSAAVMLSVTLMMSYASRGRNVNLLAHVVVLFIVAGILTAIAWLPSWAIVVGVIAAVAMFAGQISNMVRR